MQSTTLQKLADEDYIDDGDLITAFTAGKISEEVLYENLNEILDGTDSETSDEELETLALKLLELSDECEEKIFDLDDVTFH